MAGIEVGLGRIVKTFRFPSSRASSVGASLHVPTPLGESTKNELLSKAGADSFCSADCEVSKYQADSAIRSGKIEVRKAGRRQISAQAGVIRHGFSAIASGDERAEHGMPESRAD